MPATSAPEPRFAVRHLQLVRALFAALAAVMITFSPDHSVAIGLAVFSGFAIATGLMFAIAAWLTYPAGRRRPAALLATVTILAGMATGVSAWRTTEMLFAAIILWAAIAGSIELISGWATVRRERREKENADGPSPEPSPADEPAPARRGVLPAPWRPAHAPTVYPVTAQERSEARDGIVVGALTLLLALAFLLIPAGYRLDYVIEEAGSFTLTGTTIAVGVFGGYTAIVAVYLAIAGFSPRRPEPAAADAPTGDAVPAASATPTASAASAASDAGDLTASPDRTSAPEQSPGGTT